MLSKEASLASNIGVTQNLLEEQILRSTPILLSQISGGEAPISTV